MKAQTTSATWADAIVSSCLPLNKERLEMLTVNKIHNSQRGNWQKLCVNIVIISFHVKPTKQSTLMTSVQLAFPNMWLMHIVIFYQDMGIEHSHSHFPLFHQETLTAGLQLVPKPEPRLHIVTGKLI